MIHHLSERRHRADLDTIPRRANSPQFLDSAQIDHHFGLPDSILEPVEAVEPSGRWLTDTASAHGRLRIWNVQRGPLHINRYIQNRRRFVVMESLRKHFAIVRIEHPLLTDRMPD